MSAWLLQRPPRTDEALEFFLESIDGETVRTTPLAIMAKRFWTAEAARQFASSAAPHLDSWRIVRR
jgi:hypothetical protein